MKESKLIWCVGPSMLWWDTVGGGGGGYVVVYEGCLPGLGWRQAFYDG